MELSESTQKFLQACTESIDLAAEALRAFNRDIHSRPETAYQEYYAVEQFQKFLQDHDFGVATKTYGLETSFVAEAGEGDPVVVICAEYDALPGIGHACGHNLIATSSLAAFLGAAKCIQTHQIPGRVRLLGTPAEEGGGGKALLIDAGAFKENIVAAIMAHPFAQYQFGDEYGGLAGLRLIASFKFKVEFHGRTAHAAGEPWNGVNALDAAVATYNNISLLRQQMRPDERVHGVIEEGGTVPNVVTDFTRMNWYVRSTSLKNCEELLEKVKKCCDAAALSTGCELKYIWAPTYKDLRVNLPLCQQYAADMKTLTGVNVKVEEQKPFTVSTDMGNVSYEVPSFHGAFGIPTDQNVAMHNPRFASHAGTEAAHDAAIKAAKGMAALAVRVLTERDLAVEVRKAFESA